MTLEELQFKYKEIPLKRAENLSGQKFNRLTALYRVDKSARNAFWACRCDCGEYTVVKAAHLKKGEVKSCGCWAKEEQQHRSSSRFIDLSGQTFGYWKVLSRAENDKNGSARWNCLCTACGKEKVVSGYNLKNGVSTNCGCVRMEKMRQTRIKDETGKDYGFLHVERMATDEEKPRHDRMGVYWNCTCTNCGRKNVIIFGDYLRNGDTKSCGCIQSVNETLVAQMLDASGIKYRQQIMFDDLTRTGRKCDRLMFDFGIYDGNDQLIYIIEYDGYQHFDKKSFYGVLEQATRPNDLLKNKYCFEHNIPLIRIPFDQKYTIEDLKLETTHFLFTPDIETEYYALRDR